jgi:hypothetical protein
LIIFGIFMVSLLLAAALRAPEWLQSAILIGYPVTWLVTGTIIQIRHRD